MLQKISQNITSFFVQKKVFEEELYEWYVYTIQKQIMKTLGVVTMLLVGNLFLGLTEIFLFLIGLFCIRRRSGGYHTKNWWSCWIVSLAVICINALINNSNLNLKEDELVGNKTILMRIIILEIVVAVVLRLVSPEQRLTNCFVLGIFTASISILVEVIIKVGRQYC